MSSLEEREAIALRTANEARAAFGLPPIEIGQEDASGEERPSDSSGGADEAEPKSGNRSRRAG